MEFKPGHTVGIDLGTTFSTIAQLDEEGNPVPMPNEDDEVETPSLILLTESGHVIVGPNRTRAAMEDPDHVVERIKRHMGNVEFKRTFDGREITPEFLSALILKKLRQDAEKRIGKIGNAVITVPYYFNDARRKATQDAGQIAGLNVIDIINEPTAATLTYAWQRGELGASGRRSDKPRLALVYDLGGGTFDVTVVRYTPTPLPGAGHRRRRATGRRRLERPAAWTTWPRSSRRSTASIRASRPPPCRCCATTATRPRSNFRTMTQATISLPPRGQGARRCTVTREQFEEMTADLLQRTADTTELVLEQAKITPEQISTRSCWWAVRR